MRLTNLVTKITAASMLVFSGISAQAQQVNQDLQIIGAPVNGSIGFQPAATSVARDLQWLDGMLLWITGFVTILVTLLMLYVIVRYNRRVHPKPATFTHNSPLEVVWTIVPVVILVFIGAFSLPILFNQQEIPEGEIHIKATGYQWYWGFEYTDEAVAFESYMIGSGEGNLNPQISAELAEAGYTDAEFKLATDTALVIPVGKVVVIDVTGADVIHSFKVPAFGIMQDAVPGRTAQTWFKADVEGIYFGQCSELCGKDHSFMPLTVKVVSEAAYAEWLAAAKIENGA